MRWFTLVLGLSSSICFYFDPAELSVRKFFALGLCWAIVIGDEICIAVKRAGEQNVKAEDPQT